MKKLENLKGVKTLNKSEQRNIKGEWLLGFGTCYCLYSERPIGGYPGERITYAEISTSGICNSASATLLCN